jgi:ribosomal protein L11 methyltransferase
LNWLEVSLTVNGEAAEAVADVLTRFAPEGVAIEATQIETTPDDAGQAIGPVNVRAYLPADANLEKTRTALEEALWHLGQILPLPTPNYQTVAQVDWAEAWKVNFHPLRLGRRLMIVPAWLNPPLEPDDIPIRIDPGMAFGTGTHPTTQLCLAAIEKHLRPGQSVLDLGTGSGILSVAAAKLGASPILALDIDSEAVRVARENTALNSVAERIQIEQGSLAEILAGRFSLRAAELVVANILARVIIELLGQGLDQTVKPGGLLMVSGILDSQAYEVRAALKATGLNVLAEEHLEDWVAIIARHAE